VFDPLHYLALIEQKINALDQAAPLAGWQLPEEFATRKSRVHRGAGPVSGSFVLVADILLQKNGRLRRREPARSAKKEFFQV
jgi:hypothetical protein